MKQFIKLIVLMLIGLALNGCYNAKEMEAIEECKKSCMYPLTFEVIETSSTSSYDNGGYVFKVTYSCKNAFGVPCLNSRTFFINKRPGNGGLAVLWGLAFGFFVLIVYLLLGKKQPK